jgi:hypothetical protein
MAARGTRNMDDGEQTIDDAGLAAELRRIARRIHARALIAAAVATLVALAFPA